MEILNISILEFMSITPELKMFYCKYYNYKVQDGRILFYHKDKDTFSSGEIEAPRVQEQAQATIQKIRG